LKKFSEPGFPGHVLPATQFDGFGLIRQLAALSRIDRLLLQPHFITSQHDAYDLGGPETVPESDWDQRGTAAPVSTRLGRLQ
jgi:hypothetical protein